MSVLRRPICSVWNTEIAPKSAITIPSTSTGRRDPILGSWIFRRVWRTSRGRRLMRIMGSFPLSERQANRDGQRGGHALHRLALEQGRLIAELLERIHDVTGHLVSVAQEFLKPRHAGGASREEDPIDALGLAGRLEIGDRAVQLHGEVLARGLDDRRDVDGGSAPAAERAHSLGLADVVAPLDALHERVAADRE